MKVKNVIKGLLGKYRIEEISIIDSDRVCYSGSVDGWKATEVDMILYKKEVESREVLKHIVHNGRKAFIFIGNPCEEMGGK